MMYSNFDPFELTDAIARIACHTREPDTGRELMKLADRLLTDAGLPKLPIIQLVRRGLVPAV
jgi:hypothetical protein